MFHQATQLTGLVLTELDGTAKGCIVIALHRALGTPPKPIGVGGGLHDLQPFAAQVLVQALFEG